MNYISIVKLRVGAIIMVLILQVSCTSKNTDQDAEVRTVSQLELIRTEVLNEYSDVGLAEDGILDVTKAPYYADPHGLNDATKVLQQALKDARDSRMILYLPEGRYLVSNTIYGIQGTIRWDQWSYDGFSDPWLAYASFEYPNVIMGSPLEGRSVLVLADNAPGFNDPDHPKPVLHFWARMECGNIDKKKAQPNINFNQKIVDIDFELGDGNPGAIAIDHQGAEGSVIEDVTIEAFGAFAGLHKAPGSGGSVHGVTVKGGRFGFYIRSNDRHRGSQPSPLVSSIRLIDQTENAILYDGRGALTIVGAIIDGAGIKSEAPPSVKINGALNIVDALIKVKNGGTAISGNHSVVLDNVYIEGTDTIMKIGERYLLKGDKENWIHISLGAISSVAQQKNSSGKQFRTDDLWLNGAQSQIPYLKMDFSEPLNPESLIEMHDYPHPFPSGFSSEAVNVKDPPYNAVGNGVSDDADAIQRAINENEIVFIPKGTYAISRTLVLNEKTKLVGIGNVQTIITALDGKGDFSDPDKPKPLVETVDDPDAETVLAFLKLLVPVRNPCVYALRWRTGRNSIVRNVYSIREHWHPHGTSMGYPMIRIEGSGGGRWYTNVLLHWWDQGPTYRHLFINGTSEALNFYMLEPQHGRGTTMVEITESSNFDIFSMKSEGDYGVISISRCSDFRIFGYAGNCAPSKGFSIFDITDSEGFLLANINPQHKKPGSYGALGISSDPLTWNILKESKTSEGKTIEIKGTEQFSLYLRRDLY